MSDTPKTLEALIVVARELEPWMANIQLRLPTALGDNQIHRLQDHYYEWMAESMTALPVEQRQAFHACFTGQIFGTPSLPGISIQAFIIDPAATREDIGFKQIFQRNRQPGALVWKHPYASHFLPGFRRQISILNEARAWLKVTSSPMGIYQPPTTSHMYHSEVLKAAGSLYNWGHYRQAVLAASTELINAVANKAGVAASGAGAMQQVFSKKEPILRVAAHPEEQQGYMQLFAGMVGAVRNTTAHPKMGEPDMDMNEALEWLGFLSALFRILERTEKIDPGPNITRNQVVTDPT